MTPSRLLRRHWRETLLVLAWLLPILSLFAFGVMWLRENDALLPWLLGAMVLGVSSWPVRRSLRRHLKRQNAELIEQEAHPLPDDWGPREREAFERAKAVARDAAPLTFQDIKAARDLALQIAHAVASYYNPDHERPEFAIPVTDALLLAETILHEFRKSVPFLQHITIEWLMKGAELGPTIKFAKILVDVAYTAFLIVIRNDPLAGVTRIIKGRLDDHNQDSLSHAAKAVATRAFVIRVGTAAVNIYSGRLSHSREELVRASHNETQFASQSRMAPPRLLLVGQSNAGKSSLVNALVEDVVCDVQTIPTPTGPSEHMLSVDGEVCAVLIDQPGLTNDDTARTALVDAVERCDLIVWTVSSTQPGRDADVRALSALRAHFNKAPDRHQPPIIVALTQVDRLSPAGEWEPGYDWCDPIRPKERTIAAAVKHVADTLQVPHDAVIPIAMPSAPPGVEAWNVEYLWARVDRDLGQAKFRQVERLRLQKGTLREDIRKLAQFVGKLIGYL